MCGRFSLTLPSDAISQLFAAIPTNDLPVVPNFNICPTNQIHAITTIEQTRRLSAMRWGFLPHWYKSPTDGPLLINARAETIAEKPAFKSAARTGRCLIPATGFYEWTKDSEGRRLPWYIARRDQSPLVFAGVWQVWDKGEDPLVTCAIVTCTANETLAKIHHRMPVILAEADWPLWLGEAGHGAAKLMKAAPEGELVFHRVSPEVNSNRASGADLISVLES